MCRTENTFVSNTRPNSSASASAYSSGSNYLHRRYWRATVVMLAGWLAGLAVYGASYLYALRESQAAAARAQTIWNNSEGVDPSSLTEIDRFALLDLIKAKRHPLTKNGPPEKSLAEDSKNFKLSPEDLKKIKILEPRSDLIHQFLRWVQSNPYRGAAVVVGVDGWNWAIPHDSSRSWSDEPGYGGPIDDWWFVDPATGETTFKNLSSVRHDMERPGLGIAIALIFSMPRLWYVRLARLREVRDPLMRSH